MTRGPDYLDGQISRLVKRGMSREEAIHYLYVKTFAPRQKRRFRLSKRSRLTLILLSILVAASPLLYLFGSALAPRVSVTLIYEGNWSRVKGLGLLGKNWFFKGEKATLEFLVRNGYHRPLNFTVYLQTYGGGPKVEVGSFYVPGGLAPELKRVNVSISTSDLNESLYEVELVPQGTGLTIARDSSSKYNFMTYPWLIAVMQPMPYLVPNESEAHGIPPLVVPYGLGINIHFIAPSQRELFELSMIQQAGFKLVRMDFCWGCTEGEKGIYDFSAYEALTHALRAHGIRPLYILDYGNSLYGSLPGGMPTSSQLSEFSQAYAMWASNASKAFKGNGIIWEIWNEPNGNSWSGSGGVNGYSMLAACTLTALSKENATAVAPALAGADFLWLSQFLSDLNSSGTLKLLSAVSVHPYRPTSPETAMADYATIRSIGVKSLIESEWGYAIGGSEASITTLIGQADYYARIYLTNLYCKVPVSILYDWRDDGWDLSNSEDDYGVMASPSMGNYFAGYFPGLNLTYLFIKPSYYSIYTTVRILQGLSPVQRYNFSNRAYGLLFRGEGREVVAIWSDGALNGVAPTIKSVPVYLKLNVTSLTDVNAFGLSSQMTSGTGTYEIEAGPTPQYLILSR